MEKPRILIVDDDCMLTDMWRMLLELTGRFVVGVENNGTAAVETARQFHPDLIFLDVCLPDKNGGEIAAELSADPALKSTPIVFLTGLSREEAAEFHGSGRYTVLAKPFKTHEFIACADQFFYHPVLDAA
jgi:CheY-like chemotaxis protein